MPTKTTIGLCMIVKNEAPRLARALKAASKISKYWIICDTGSTDETLATIEQTANELKATYEIHSVPFVNFEQARNAALDWAHASDFPWDYLLLQDADMELIVEDPEAIRAARTRFDPPAFSLEQRTHGFGSLSYWNIRLIHRDLRARYIGVTHEYLRCSMPSKLLSGMHFIDHADGSNRIEKFERDLKLLEQAIKDDPTDARTVFYLAQTYRDLGRYREAVEMYGQRATMGGFEEEVWYSIMSQARCHRELGEIHHFVQLMAVAIDKRPTRAEPFYELARYFRAVGSHAICTLLAEAGLRIPYPEDDVLFIEPFVYRFGLIEEISIAAFYSQDPEQWSRGKWACLHLIENSATPPAQREQAERNLKFYEQTQPDTEAGS